MKFAVFAMLICAAAASGAPPEAQFTWKGEVDGTVLLRVHAKRVELETRKGAPVQHPEFHFSSALPQTREDVRLEVHEGRGAVRIADQPRVDNDYTAAILIEDLQDGASPYSIALYWEPDQESESAGRREHLTWNGLVERELVVECREKLCESAEGGKFKFTRPLPKREVRTTLDETRGRADIRIIEQPSEQNNYTVRVQIHPLPGGGGECAFGLSWSRR